MLNDSDLMARVSKSPAHPIREDVPGRRWAVPVCNHLRGGDIDYWTVAADTEEDAAAVAREYVARIDGSELLDGTSPEGDIEILDDIELEE